MRSFVKEFHVNNFLSGRSGGINVVLFLICTILFSIY